MHGAAVARAAIAEAHRAGGRVGAFICESILSCGGQIVLPPGYLAGVYHEMRKEGALCIADEVQCGFGRVGDTMWAFETQGVVPDVVTMGKPIGKQQQTSYINLLNLLNEDQPMQVLLMSAWQANAVYCIKHQHGDACQLGTYCRDTC